MITNNGAKMFKGMLQYDVEALISFQGKEQTVSFTYGNIQWRSSNFSLAPTQDTQEPTYEDYNCVEIGSSLLTKGDQVLGFTGRNCPIITRTFTNISNDNITMTGLALYMVEDGRVFMIGKKLLSAPRTIQPGETATFSYTIKFN